MRKGEREKERREKYIHEIGGCMRLCTKEKSSHQPQNKELESMFISISLAKYKIESPYAKH